ncbi:MAG: hypothetical protein H8E34_05725 [Bacteroidetes bacterium]|nr:hypothetical protein [Bacteroidota bacterium]MBL6944921.1 hypothetical protein [Bacteroidales bacterium]
MTKLNGNKLYYSVLLFLIMPIVGLKTTSAQQVRDSLFILDAIILTSDSLLPVQNAHIISKFNRWGTISNKQGRFKLYVQNADSILITSIGYSPLILQMTPSILSIDSIVEIRLPKDTVTINEVVIRGYWDYATMKQIVIDMKPIDLSQFYPDWEGTELLYMEPRPMSFKGPIQALYDAFNYSARLQRKLIRNRKEYNQLMYQMGRYLDTIPAIPEHKQELQY